MRTHTTIDGGTITLPTGRPDLEAFFDQLQHQLDDTAVSLDDFIALGYGVANPLLKRDGERAVVTPEVFQSPWYRVLADMLARKERQASGRSAAPPPPEPLIILARVGSKPGASFRVKGAQVAGPKLAGAREGTLLPGWRRAAVLAAKPGEGARFWQIEPAPDGFEAILFEGFYLRGAFRIVAKENNERRARDAFAAFDDE